MCDYDGKAPWPKVEPSQAVGEAKRLVAEKGKFVNSNKLRLQADGRLLEEEEVRSCAYPETARCISRLACVGAAQCSHPAASETHHSM